MKKESFKKFRLKGILTCVLVGIVMSLVSNQSAYQSVKASTTYLKTQTLSTLPQARHIQLSRGNGHDRQYPGVWLKAGQTIKARQTNPLFKSNINFDLSANDAAKEVQGKILSNGTVTTLTAKADSVPFVHTPLVAPGVPQPVIEYEIETDSEEIPIYVEGDNEQAFQNKWNTSNAPFAIFDSTRVQMLIPIADRNKLFTTFDGSMLKLAQFYTYLLERYDQYAGLEDSPADPIDLNVRAKYFLKANAHGHGWAYYSVDHVAQNAAQMGDLLSIGHGLYHEIGHGYDFSAEDIDVTEMWNNIYAYYMETDSPYPVAPWLYKGVSIDNNENEAYGSFRSRLQFFIDIFDFVGPKKAMVDFNKAYRRALANGGIKMPMTEFMIRTLSTSSGYNIASHFENKGFPVSQELKRWAFEQGYKNITAIQPLYGISTQPGTISKAETARQTLGLSHRYTIVPTKKVEALNTTATLTVNVQAPDMSVLQGREVILYDGNAEVSRQKISGNTVVFNNVSIGEYTVKLPTMPNGLYQYDEFNYAMVTEKGATLNTKYNMLTQSLYINDVNIDYRGLGNALFAKLNYDSQKQTIDINKTGAIPHAYHTTTYASYKIYDANNNLVDSADFNGKDNSVFKRSTPFLEGYKLEIFHSEPSSRLSMTAQIDNQLLYKQTNKTETYTLRDGLLVLNSDTRTSVDILQDMLRTYLNNLIAKYGKDDAKTRIYNSVHANVIASTLNQMTIQDQQEIINEYPDLFKTLKIDNPTAVTVSVGDSKVDTQMRLSKDLKLESNGEYVATDDWKDVPVDTNSKFTTAGAYQVHYMLTDFFMFKSNQDVALTVKADSEKPVITDSLPTVELIEGDVFNPQSGVTATDNIDGDITNKLVVSGSVDTTKTGIYTLTYTVVDNAGNTASITRTVTVKPKVIPMAKIEIVKTDKETKAPLAGAEYDIKDASGKVVDHVITDMSGKAISKSFAFGVYTVIETKAPAGYTQDKTPITITLSQDNTIIPVKSEGVKETTIPIAIKGKIIVSKFDKETQNRLSGMIFKVKHLETGTEKIVEMKQYNVMELVDLSLGTYEIVETKAPDGYEVDTTIYTIVIDKNNNEKALNIYDVRKSETKVAIHANENRGIISLPETGNNEYKNSLNLIIIGIVSAVFLIVFIVKRKKLF